MITLEPYNDSILGEWDDFVRGRAVNGGFMHTRNFIDYHPKGKFIDRSLVFRNDKGSIAAVIPACEIMEDGRRIFHSHRGCTYGGVVVGKKFHNAGHFQEIIDLLEGYLRESGFHGAVLKLLSGLYTGVGSDLAEYLFTLNGYSSYAELNSYIDFSRYDPDILSNFSTAKRTHVRNGIKAGMVFRPVTDDTEVAGFHRLLTENLRKYGVSPVHTLVEILDFKNSRISDIVRFYGVFLEERMIAGGMVYDYPAGSAVHTTYLSADPEFLNPSPATFLYYGIISDARALGRRYLSFGISTEERGSFLNRGLIHSKESFGSLHSINRTMFKSFQEAMA